MTKEKKHISFSYWLHWLSIPILFLVVLEIFSFQKRQKEITKIENRISQHQFKSRIFMGSSHTAFAICDTFAGVSNVGSYNEPFLFTLKKIQLLKPKSVILSVNIQNVQYNYERIFDRGILSMPQNAYLYQSLDEEEKSDIHTLMSFETRALFETQRVFPFVGKKLQNEDTTWLFGGWRNPGIQSELDSFRIAKRLEDEFIHTTYSSSPFQWKYLTKLISYCKQENIELIILSTPLYSKFWNSIPEKEKKNFENQLEPLLQKAQVRRIDFTTFTLDESCFFDSDHLNKKGAVLFTDTLLKKLLKTISLY